MSNPKNFSTFDLIGVNKIPAINAQVELYQHKVTGALHAHIAADNTENVFMVAFRTMPSSSNGVAHILEHTALCGSAQYPTRDPFFSMIRRSLNSFMNAFTSTDWTAYPFASPNKKDFNNLLGVYLDAAFFPRLSEMDFLQEGHRLDFKTTGDKTSDLIFKGVVFNEMKGAMSPPGRVLSQAIQTALCPGTTYEVNSGGEPADIPSLTHQGLKDFHATHYHPSNSIFMTYGDISAYEHQEQFENKVLNKFTTQEKAFSVPDVKRFTTPKNEHIKYAFDETDITKRTYVQMGWLLGQSSDAYENFKASFLSMLLMGDSSAPLQAVLESSDLGTSPKCGFSDDNKEMAFFAGLEGSEVKHAKDVEDLILDTLNEVAKNGIPAERVEALLDIMEVDVRNLESGGYPLGMSLMFGLMANAVHGGDLLNALDVEPVLNKLRAEAAKPDFVQNLVKDLLLNNNHRVTIIAEPDTGLSKVKNDVEAAKLAKIKSKMSDTELDTVTKQASDLDARQSAPDDTSCLPTVTMADIPTSKTYPKGTITGGSVQSTAYKAGTNGIVSQGIIVDLPQLTERQIMLLPYYAGLVTEIAVGKRSYLEVGEWQTSMCNRFSAHASFRSALGDTDKVDSFMTFSAGGLERHGKEMISMMVETINDVSFREHDRIKDLVGQMRIGKENSITGSGHVIAASAASHGMSACGDIAFKASGLESVRFIKKLDKSFADKNVVADMAKELEELHQLIKHSPRQVMVVAEPDKVDAIAANLAKETATIAVDNTLQSFVADKVNETVNDMWVVNTQVNFCAKAYKVVPSTHADAPALQVLAGYMKNNFIHTAIREKGGAYGGGVIYSADNGTFSFTSYRDPRLSETLSDYDAAINWMKTSKHDEEKVREAIFGIISSIDSPSTPIRDASGHFSNTLNGRTDSVRSDYRKRILAVTVADLVRVANTYLDPTKANVTVITSKTGFQKEGDLGLNVINL